MPPKRRKAAEEPDDPAPKRVTRSSSKRAAAQNAPSNEGANSTSKAELKSKPSGSKSKNEASKLPSVKTKSDSQTKAAANKKASSKSTPEPKTSTINKNSYTFDISHPSLKNPIPCQEYSAIMGYVSPLIFTHGAGGTLSAPAVVNFCNGYSIFGSAMAFQGNMNLAARVKGFHACIEHLKESEEGGTWGWGGRGEVALGGRSMGARAAVIAASELLSQSKSKSTAPKTLVLVSYPLKGPNNDIRDKILLDLPSAVNVLFVIGDRDSMCPLELLNDVRKKMKAKSWLVVVAGMDHGMHGKNERALVELSGKWAAEWVGGERGAKEKVLTG